MRYQKVIRHGNALAIVIPAAVCRELEIHRGDMVIINVLERGGVLDGTNSLYLEISPVVEATPPTNGHGKG